MKRILVLGMLVTGCFNSHEIVTERAAREYRCPAGQVQTEELGGNAYRVWACGTQATYACSPRLGMCMKEPGSGVAAAQPAMPEGPASPTAPFPTSGPPPFAPAPTPPGPPPPAPAPPNPWETPQ